MTQQNDRNSPLARLADYMDLPREPFRLAYDTAHHSLPEGLRSRDVTSRHQLYEGQDYLVDVRVDRDPRSSRAMLVGQLASRHDPAAEVPAVRASLFSGQDCLESNRLGEFQLEYEPRRLMNLCLPLPDHKMIDIPIDRRTRADGPVADELPPRSGGGETSEKR